MSNYNQLKITYQGGQETAITLTSSTIQDFEYQYQNIISVEVPEIVETIGEYAFCDNNGLSSIVLNEGLQTIGNQAFQHGLYTAVTIPSTVTSIGMNAFNMSVEQSKDKHPFTVTCLAATPPTLDDDEGITFSIPEYLQAIYVPAESVDAYKAASNWANYASKIQAIPEPPKPVRYIQTFETAADWYGAYADNKLGAPFVVYLEDEQRIVWNEVPEPPAPDYSTMPLTFEILSGGNIYWVDNKESKPQISIQYSINGGSWEEMPWRLYVNTGDLVQFRGDNQSYEGTHLVTSTGVAEYNIYGNIMSLVDSTGYTGVTSVAPFAFSGFFSAQNYYDSLIHSAEHLVLPATTLGNSCYQGMFFGCSAMTTAPVILPATTLAEACYEHMFNYCTGLTSAPELPATTLVSRCYSEMFANCTSLTAAPELPATGYIPDNACYEMMFYRCSNLNYIKCLGTYNRYGGGTMMWTSNVAASGTFVKYPGVEWASGDDGIPTGWTVIDADI